MLFIIAWLIAMGTSELLLWSYGYLHLISPYFISRYALCLSINAEKFIKIKTSTSMRKIESMRMGIMFVLSMLVMLAITVNIRFFTLIYTGL